MKNHEYKTNSRHDPYHDVSSNFGRSYVAAAFYLLLPFCSHAAESAATTPLQGKGGPSVPNVSVPAFLVGSPVSATATSVDPDGDVIDYEFRWCSEAGITGNEPLDSRCVEGSTQVFGDSANRYVAARALTQTGYPLLNQGKSAWSTESVSGIAGNAPEVSSVSILGPVRTGYLLTIDYVYSDVDLDEQGSTTYQWYRDGIAILDATTDSYRLRVEDENKTFTVGVTPVSTTGVPNKGAEVISPAVLALAISEIDVPGLGIFSTPQYTPYNQQNALSYCAGLEGGNWRLPTYDELRGLYQAYPRGQIYTVYGWQNNDYYRSSTPYPDIPNSYYGVLLGGATITGGPVMSHDTVYVTCIR